ncbi:flavin reductase family protein [Alcanivorax sp. DP30]|uniref:flavin reductase family protein n=1 Tax=Alcanivorax sp. DP30 TaxID=2606217 RepID=UPI00136EFF9C|nr:flavin reductase family protein [Alcanivorax sp. DP30]MZR63328.1 flavin oxidoreductase [Alcanivorax sp. DP30]
MHFNTQDLDSLPRQTRVNLINSLSGFKSANLIGTRATSGQENLAIVSSCFHLGADPALMGMIIRPHSVDRHTLEYLQETGCYTINHVHQDIIAAAHQTSARYPQDVSEFDAVGLNTEYCHDFAAPFVHEARIRLGMKLMETQELAVNGTVLVIGAIEHVLLAEGLMEDDGYVDVEQAGTVALSGLDSYHLTRREGRWQYAKPDRPATKISD